MKTTKQLILVDIFDNEIGEQDKDTCHYGDGMCHRALSVFLFNDANEMLITRRSKAKKTWPLFWSNACCTHPQTGQDCGSAAITRLQEELGVTLPVEFLFKFEYNARYDDEWCEHELDWVFVSRCNGPFNPNPEEIIDWKFVAVDELRDRMRDGPEQFTPWFRICLDRVLRSQYRPPAGP